MVHASTYWCKSESMKIAFVLGTRPEIIKLYPLIKDCIDRGISYIILHTNQHYDVNMDEVFFKQLGLPEPTYALGVGSGTQGVQLGKMLVGIENVFQHERPDLVVVQGDTNTVLAGTLMASRQHIPIAHVEAGLRSYDRTMPEEVNRIMVDGVADYLFCPTTIQRDILLSENVSASKIFVTGNTVVDAVYHFVELAEQTSRVLARHKLKSGDYFLLTCHRPDNTDNESRFTEILDGVSRTAVKEKVQCIFPMHPRTNKYRSIVANYPDIIAVDPLDYFDSLLLQKHAKMIFTDSGGVQEESCILKKLTVILRKNTERPETTMVGGAMLLSEISSENIQRCYQELVCREVFWRNPFGDGNAAKKIMDIIVS
jgi:UDP-N-acetylglucosamine 2-epimerase (non-hydrolysing)